MNQLLKRWYSGNSRSFWSVARHCLKFCNRFGHVRSKRGLDHAFPFFALVVSHWFLKNPATPHPLAELPLCAAPDWSQCLSEHSPVDSEFLQFWICPMFSGQCSAWTRENVRYFMLFSCANYSSRNRSLLVVIQHEDSSVQSGYGAFVCLIW